MDAFHTLAEVSVAIAGFSSLAIVFRGRASDWRGQDYVSLAFALSWGIGSVFLSLLPILLAEFGISLAVGARIGLLSAVVYMLTIAGFLTYVRKRIESRGGGKAGLNLGLSFLYCVIVIGALAAASGIVPGPPHAWLAATIILLMAHATAELGFFVTQVIRQSAD